ncbi:SPOR domain-containing protein [Sulfurirhabdus autotrophica]|uniref:Sporulation related protein n=1 Tax=Sulfurirhabdus autotrophica TaxID=1706046 RepID=A0A4R3XTK9_9PROT|nr:SPOR domain-containing protein [Sulfurirhabdus autotrophica]TCV82212.1 sporulation related protein [Sulfurirhabdus autotrophica]
MSRDYKKPAARSTNSKKGGKSMVTGILIGLFVGLAIALAVAIFINSMPSPFVKQNKPATIPAPLPEEAPKHDSGNAAKPADNKDTKTADKPRFDFYTILPGKEEAVTEQQIKQAAQQPNAAENQKDSYYLQIGSFQNEADADNLKAKLALLGVETSIQTATIPDKGIWHRVRVGPYSTLPELNRARATLTQNGLQSSLIKVHDTQANSTRN